MNVWKKIEEIVSPPAPKSVWEALQRIVEGPNFAMPVSPRSSPSEEIVLSDREAEAIEDASGQMGV